MKIVFLIFDMLENFESAVWDLTEVPQGKNRRLLENFHEITNEEFVAKMHKPQNRPLVLHSGWIWTDFDVIWVFGDFDVLQNLRVLCGISQRVQCKKI